MTKMVKYQGIASKDLAIRSNNRKLLWWCGGCLSVTTPFFLLFSMNIAALIHGIFSLSFISIALFAKLGRE